MMGTVLLIAAGSAIVIACVLMLVGELNRRPAVTLVGCSFVAVCVAFGSLAGALSQKGGLANVYAMGVVLTALIAVVLLVIAHHNRRTA